MIIEVITAAVIEIVIEVITKRITIRTKVVKGFEDSSKLAIDKTVIGFDWVHIRFEIWTEGEERVPKAGNRIIVSLRVANNSGTIKVAFI